MLQGKHILAIINFRKQVLFFLRQTPKKILTVQRISSLQGIRLSVIMSWSTGGAEKKKRCLISENRQSRQEMLILHYFRCDGSNGVKQDETKRIEILGKRNKPAGYCSSRYSPCAVHCSRLRISSNFCTLPLWQRAEPK